MHQPNSSKQTTLTQHHQVVERRVIKQLIEAILFENIAAFTYQAGYFYFSLGGNQYCAEGKFSSFSRVRINAHNMHCIQGEYWQPIVLIKLVADLPTNNTVKAKLATELEQTIKLCCWNKQFLTPLPSRRELTYRELESAIDEGHPYHPCFKARTGFSEQDHQHYGPECANGFQLHWLAVRRRYLKRRFNGVSEQTFWQQTLGAENGLLLQQALAQQTNDCSAFSFMPIHPWQWLHLQEKLAPAIAQEQLYYLGAIGDKYQASISVRTLFNVSDPKKANVKLPLNMVNTSSLRTFESHSICTAPVLSHWLEQLVASDPYLQNNMVFLYEYAGIRLTNDGPKAQPWIDELDGQLGVIFRESLLSYYDNEDNIAPFVAVNVIEQDGKPFIEPWVKQYGCQQWLKQLIETTVIPVWHLLVHHGIALEAHGQNILLAHENGWPSKVILRDFHESLEYVHDYLAQPELAPIFGELEHCYNHGEPNQYYWMTSIEALRELFVDTLFVFNLADLAVLFERHYQFTEQNFWQLVQQCFKDYQTLGITEQKRIEQVDLYQSNIKTESLLMKKLNDKQSAEFHHAISNPLTEQFTDPKITDPQSVQFSKQKSEIYTTEQSVSLERTSCLQ